MNKICFSVGIVLLLIVNDNQANERIELEVTTIKGNKELPRILYIVPWQDVAPERGDEQKLVLHSLFGDLFDPVLPDASATSK